MLYFEDAQGEPGRRILSRIEKFADAGQPFERMLRGHRLHQAVESLLGEAVLLFKEKVNLKLPGGGGFEPHQDIQAGWDDYAPYFLSAAIAIDDSNPGNGCLEVAPGQHRRGWIGERWKPLTPQETAAMRFEPVPLAPGDVVVFDCFLPHRSAPNASDRARRNLYLTYNRARDGDHRERYFANKRRSFPPDNEREAGKTYVYRV
jgi:2-aminoethylphosphonate dioxygenase